MCSVIPTMIKSLRTMSSMWQITNIHTSAINLNPKTMQTKAATLSLTESVSVIPAASSTPRMMTPSMWLINSFHTSTIFCKASKDGTKSKPTKSGKKNPAICSILNLIDHKYIQKGLLADDEVLGTTLNRAAKHILDINIKVAKVALESNITVSIERLGHIDKTNYYPQNLHPEIKTGRYSVEEDLLIRQNWEKLRADLNLTEDKAKAELLENRRKGDDEGLELKRNIIGYFLSQGLPKIRLATEVYQRARTVLCGATGDFTDKEDEIIMQGSREGKTFTELATQLGRYRETLRDRYKVLTSTHTKQGLFTLEEDEVVLREVFVGNSDVLQDRKITEEVWEKIGDELHRKPSSVQDHWRVTLEPILTRYHAGTLHMDVKDVLISHLVEQGVSYAQDADWKELAKLPKFAGTTSRYLSRQYQGMRAYTAKKHELSQVEVTTQQIQRYRAMVETRQTSATVLKHQEKIINFYITNILRVKHYE